MNEAYDSLSTFQFERLPDLQNVYKESLLRNQEAFFIQKRKARIVFVDYGFFFLTKINLCLLFEFSRCSISNTPIDLIIGVSFSNP